MNLNIRSGTVGYNNKILVSDGKFNLGKNDEVMEVPSVSPKVSPGQLRSGMIFLCEISYPRGQIIV